MVERGRTPPEIRAAACPDENTMMRSAEGTLDRSARVSLRRHLLRCARCAVVLVEVDRLVRAGLSPSDAR